MLAAMSKSPRKATIKRIIKEPEKIKSITTLKRDIFCRKYYFVQYEEEAKESRIRYSEYFDVEIDAKKAQKEKKLNWQPWTKR